MIRARDAADNALVCLPLMLIPATNMTFTARKWTGRPQQGEVEVDNLRCN